MDFDDIKDGVISILGLLVVPALFIIPMVFTQGGGSPYDTYNEDYGYDYREANAPSLSELEAANRADEMADADADAAYFATQAREEHDSCIIKGNISYSSGERIYHMPGDAYYNETVINTAYGERMFCSEYEAQAAGWRRAYN